MSTLSPSTVNPYWPQIHRNAVPLGSPHTIPCPATIMRWFEETDPGLYRKGVTPVPPGTIGGFYEGGPGSTFICGE